MELVLNVGCGKLGGLGREFLRLTLGVRRRAYLLRKMSKGGETLQTQYRGVAQKQVNGKEAAYRGTGGDSAAAARGFQGRPAAA